MKMGLEELITGWPLLIWSPAFYQNAGFTKSWVPAYGFLGLWTLLLMGVLAMFGTR